jgi:negative regulator of sigma E activity
MRRRHHLENSREEREQIARVDDESREILRDNRDQLRYLEIRVRRIRHELEERVSATARRLST